MRAIYGRRAFGWAIGTAIVATAMPALAQSDRMEPIATPAQPTAIPRKTGTLPDAQAKGDMAPAPPLFVAIAADDPFFANSGFGLIESWKAAKRPVEVHLYEQGGHGFGLYRKPTTSSGWFDAFARWMEMHGWLKRAG